MNRRRRSATIWPAVWALVFIAAAGGAAEGGPSDAPLALTGLDPTELVEGREVKGKADLVTTHGKFRYSFASEANMSRFKAEPERYAIHGDGSCVVYPDIEADPSIFAVHEGHIYAFATNECAGKFEGDPDFYLSPEFQAEFWRSRAQRYYAERNECRESLEAEQNGSSD